MEDKKDETSESSNHEKYNPPVDGTRRANI